MGTGIEKEEGIKRLNDLPRNTEQAIEGLNKIHSPSERELAT